MVIAAQLLLRFYSGGDRPMRKLINAVLLAGVLCGSSACAVRVYDGPHHDYHRWDGNEDRVYRVYLTENHREYRDFNRLDKKEQEDYWAWRHSHPNGN
jgi:hypothetical protein